MPQRQRPGPAASKTDSPRLIAYTQPLAGRFEDHNLGAAAQGELDAVAGLANPGDVLRALWPRARRILAAPMPLEFPDEPPMHAAHLPIILAGVATRIMAETFGAVAAPSAADLVMEAAIIASKLDPDLSEPRRWLLAPGPRGLQVARDDRRRRVA